MISEKKSASLFLLQPLNNVKMSVKLIGGFGFVVLLFMIVMLIFQHTVGFTSRSFKDLMQVDVAIARHASTVQILMLKCRENEKHFFSLKDKKYVKQLEANIDAMIKEVGNIIDLAQRSGNEASVNECKSIIKSIQAYQAYFYAVVEAYERKGLDDHSGLIGEFNRIVDEFLRIMEQHQTEDLYLEAFRMIRYQSEYFSTKSVSKKRKLVEALKRVKATGESIREDTALITVKDALREMIPAYVNALKNYIKSESAGKNSAPYKKKMSAITDELESMLRSTYIQGVKAYILTIREHEKNYLLFKDKKYIQATHNAMDRFFAAVKNSGVPVMFIDEVDQGINDYRNAFDSLVAEDQKIMKNMATMNTAVDKIVPLVENLYKKADDDATDRENTVKNKAAYRSKIAVFIGLIAIFLGVFLSILITKGITLPVVEAVQFAHTLSQGDFTQKLKIRQNDEIGLLADALNEMVSNINSIFQHIITGIDQLTASSSQLAEISQEMTNASRKTSENSDGVAKAAENLTSNFNTVSANMDQAASNVDSVATAAEEMTVSIGNISSNSDTARITCQEAVAQTQKSSEKMNELSLSALDIGKIVEVIDEISGQTNLLALNATIEAARAGETGKGFAVVAGEIKELASKTAASTQEIKSKIQGIQEITDHSKSEIQTISSVIGNVHEIVSQITDAIDQQSKITHEIAGNVVHASHGLKEINQSMVKSSSMAGEISAEITDVNSAAGGLLENSSLVSDNARELLKLANNLKASVSQVKISLSDTSSN